jgi:3-hexulose-6-phosphate synthase/6-phospho-3-hexuloisomerase
MRPIVQISLDLTDIEEAVQTARTAVRAGVDWLEAGTPLLLAEGLHCVKRLRHEFPDYPIVADLKTMDGGYLEAEMMAKAGATHVVVMSRAHPATIKQVVRAGRDFGVKVMGDDLGEADKAAACRRMQELGVDYIVHHIGYDERRDPEVQAELGGRMPSPLDALKEIVTAVDIPVQAVGGLSLEQAVQMPLYGAPLVVLGAPLVIDADSFRTAGNDLESVLSELVLRIRENGQTVKLRNYTATQPYSHAAIPRQVENTGKT